MEIYRPPNVRSDVLQNGLSANPNPRLNVHAKEFTMKQGELSNSSSHCSWNTKQQRLKPHTSISSRFAAVQIKLQHFASSAALKIQWQCLTHTSAIMFQWEHITGSQGSFSIRY